jgi:hypothetical protein
LTRFGAKRSRELAKQGHALSLELLNLTANRGEGSDRWGLEPCADANGTERPQVFRVAMPTAARIRIDL